MDNMLEKANRLLDKCEKNGVENVDDLVGLIRLTRELTDCDYKDAKKYLDRCHSLLDDVTDDLPRIESYVDLSKIMELNVELTN